MSEHTAKNTTQIITIKNMDSPAWIDLYEELKKQPNNVVTFQSSVKPAEKVEAYRLEKAQSEQTWAQMLSQLSEQEVQKYAEFLRLTKVSDQKPEGIQAIQQELLAHPVFLLYIMERECVEELLNWNKAADGIVEKAPERSDISKWILLGLAQVELVKNEKQQIAYVRFAKDIDTVIERIKTLSLEKECDNLARIFKAMRNCINAYGCMEITQFEAVFHEHYKADITTTEFERILYWHGVMCEMIKTWKAENGIPYVALRAVPIERMLRERKRLVAEIPYCEYTVEEWKLIERYFGLAAKHWSVLYQLLKRTTNLQDDELAERFETWSLQIMLGETIDDMEMEIVFYMEEQPASLWVDVYTCLMQIVMHTGIYSLKGYSRYSLWQNYQKPLESLPFYQEDYLLEELCDIRLETQLSEMPSFLQSQIFLAISEEDPAKTVGRLAQIIGMLKEPNMELQYLIVQYLMEQQDWKRAKQELGKLRRVLSREPELYEGDIQEIDAWLQQIKKESYHTKK